MPAKLRRQVIYWYSPLSPCPQRRRTPQPPLLMFVLSHLQVIIRSRKSYPPLSTLLCWFQVGTRLESREWVHPLFPQSDFVYLSHHFTARHASNGYFCTEVTAIHSGLGTTSEEIDTVVSGQFKGLTTEWLNILPPYYTVYLKSFADRNK